VPRGALLEQRLHALPTSPALVVVQMSVSISRGSSSGGAGAVAMSAHRGLGIRHDGGERLVDFVGSDPASASSVVTRPGAPAHPEHRRLMFGVLALGDVDERDDLADDLGSSVCPDRPSTPPSSSRSRRSNSSSKWTRVRARRRQSGTRQPGAASIRACDE
jgi:hypothetical protein